ncbi:dihydroxyacetone kinase [Saccharomonospora marina XMU15]|uniref:Dihydroxyacetone kinase n=1 Tax=Saccharomonospora marina XMU15 TaxID=882083 RepID=H5WZF7_9PSEU|nr:dihydroxyacetone kinase family protein [Saccharomonospora marina]EHR49619.1 dihydroxyacetone kinase [Saccharomonospora marina XMU15]
MTRLYNDPARFSDDMVDGFVAAYDRYVRRVPNASGVLRASAPRPNKVSVVIGGGSGHYPAFCGLVGPGFADGAVIGDIFTSPSAEQAYLVGKAADAGAGVLFSYGNYGGDVMNFGLAQQRLREEGIDCRTVLVTDDIASASADSRQQRRGIAGDFCVFKAAGAAADRGEPIAEVERIAGKANEWTHTLGVAFAGCTLPGRREPLFTVDTEKMELGLGIHGEPGVRTVERLSAEELAGVLVETVLRERPEAADGRAAVLLNGLGATKYEELFVVWKAVAAELAASGVELVSPEVGELVTSLDMAGCSLTLHWLDDELAGLWQAPADTPAFRRGEVPHLAPTATAATTAVGDALAAAPESPGTTVIGEPARRAAEVVRGCLAAMADVVEREESYLGDIDAVAGDGDHGRGMLRGLRAARAAADDAALGAGGALRAAGAAWADRSGGSSGVLWGALLREIGAVVGDGDLPAAATVVDAVRRGAEVVARLGGAAVGDKTMLDALVPFADALAQRVADGAELPVAWRAAAEIAHAAAEATSELRPRVGRARPLAQRSVGTPDPGAVSFALCARAAGEVLGVRG